MTDILPLYYSALGEQPSVVPDRAFQYGLLETMRAHTGSIPLLQLHLERLARSVTLDDDAKQSIAAIAAAAALRTRSWSFGARVRLRYGVIGEDSTQSPQWDIAVVPLEESSRWDNGVVLGLCSTRLAAADTRSPFTRSVADSVGGAVRPEYLGCKLLRRDTYEQAAAEWRASSHNNESMPLLEPLLCNENGIVIEGSRSNLLIMRDGHWFTPKLNRYGVRGVMLRWLAGQVEIGEDDFTPSDLLSAEEIAVCNSVRGVVPARLLPVGQSQRDSQTSPLFKDPVSPGQAVSVLQQRISEELW